MNINSEEEQVQFLNMVDQGYVGFARPKVAVHQTEDDGPTWVVRKFERMAKMEGISYYDFIAKYSPSFSPEDWDDGPEHPNEAWA